METTGGIAFNYIRVAQPRAPAALAFFAAGFLAFTLTTGFALATTFLAFTLATAFTGFLPAADLACLSARSAACAAARRATGTRNGEQLT